MRGRLYSQFRSSENPRPSERQTKLVAARCRPVLCNATSSYKDLVDSECGFEHECEPSDSVSINGLIAQLVLDHRVPRYAKPHRNFGLRQAHHFAGSTNLFTELRLPIHE